VLGLTIHVKRAHLYVGVAVLALVAVSVAVLAQDPPVRPPGPSHPGNVTGAQLGGPMQVVPGKQPPVRPGGGPMGPRLMAAGGGPFASGGTAMAVADGKVFVVYGGALYKFDAETLDLLGSVPIPPVGMNAGGGPTVRLPGGPGGGPPTGPGGTMESQPDYALDGLRANPTIELPTGMVVVIALPSNPTTGYRWVSEIADQNVAAVVGDAFKAAANDGRVGGGGEHRFQLRGVGAGETTLKLTERRPWAGGETAQELTVKVVVRAAGPPR
jgi:inhibitor of cysteine peptidase